MEIPILSIRTLSSRRFLCNFRCKPALRTYTCTRMYDFWKSRKHTKFTFMYFYIFVSIYFYIHICVSIYFYPYVDIHVWISVYIWISIYELKYEFMYEFVYAFYSISHIFNIRFPIEFPIHCVRVSLYIYIYMSIHFCLILEAAAPCRILLNKNEILDPYLYILL